MVKKKTEEKKEKSPSKKTVKPKIKKVEDNIEKYTLSQLLVINKIKPLNAVGFLEYFGLAEDFKKEIEGGTDIVKFSKGEFKNMFERYMKRGL